MKYIILVPVPVPTLDTRALMPEFNLVYAGLEAAKPPSNYLSNSLWVTSFASAVKGVEAMPMIDSMMVQADDLALLMEQRLEHNIAERVDTTRQFIGH